MLHNDKLWGVNLHNRDYPAYRPNMDEAIRLAAEMGSTVCRFDYTPVNEDMLAYTREVIRKCHDRGMKLMLVCGHLFKTEEQIAQSIEYISTHLAGEADFFQLFNETDIYCSRTDDGFYDISDWTGMSDGYYNPVRVAEVVPKMKLALEIFRRNAPDARLIVNIGSRHFPMLDRYVEAGLKWDIIAFDIYDLAKWDHHAFFRDMEARYPGYDFMVVECNYPANDGPFTEAAQAEWVKSFARIMDDYRSERMLGVIFYELFDQPNLQKGRDGWYGEAHFGLVNMGDDFVPAQPKEAYRRLQAMLKKD